MRLSGWTDTDLSPRGESQIELLADHFNRHHGHIDELYTSPLIRARRTAEAIGALTGHTPVPLDDLREMYFGDLDGRPFEELREAYAHLLAADENSEVEDFMWPGGESRSHFTARVLGVTNLIAARHAGRAVGVVSHGGFIATLLTILSGESRQGGASGWCPTPAFRRSCGTVPRAAAHWCVMVTRVTWSLKPKRCCGWNRPSKFANQKRASERSLTYTGLDSSRRACCFRRSPTWSLRGRG